MKSSRHFPSKHNTRQRASRTRYDHVCKVSRTKNKIDQIENIQKLLRGHPGTPTDNLFFHQGDVNSRTAEGGEAQLEKKKSDFGQDTHAEHLADGESED